MKTFMVSCRMVLALALVCMAESAGRAAANDDDEGEPRYMLAAFDAKGRDLKHYAIDNERQIVYITDLTSRKQLWKGRVGISRNHLCEFKLYLAPDQRHAVLSFTGNPHAGSSFDWISIPEGKGAAASVDIQLAEKDRLRAMVADVCSIPKSKIQYLYVHFLDWISNEKCRLKWECTAYDDTDQEKYHVGIVAFSMGKKSEQKLQITSFLKDLTLEQAVDAHFGAKVTLRP